MMELRADRKIRRVAILVAVACVLQIAESLVPTPIPGLKLGLANILTLTALVLLGFGCAMEIAVLRTILSSLIMGTFMSPAFLLSFAGAIVSTAIMGLFYWLSGVHRYLRLSVIGISIIGALTHNMVQLCLAYLLLVKHSGIFLFLPWLIIGAVATGWVVGVVTGGVCCRLFENSRQSIIENTGVKPPSLLRHYKSGSSLLHRVPPAIKISFILTLAVMVLLFENLWFFLVLLLLVLLLTVVSGTSLKVPFSRAMHYSTLLAAAFLLPIFFNSDTQIIASFGPLSVTEEGVLAGSLFTLRILVLLFASCILIQTTSPGEMARGLSQVVSPLHYIGISRIRFAATLAFAWEAIPYVWGITQGAIVNVNLKNSKNLKSLMPLLSSLIATLYISADKEFETMEKIPLRQFKSYISTAG